MLFKLRIISSKRLWRPADSPFVKIESLKRVCSVRFSVLELKKSVEYNAEPEQISVDTTNFLYNSHKRKENGS